MRALHKILVVDDDPVVGKSFNRVLSEKGYLVITAANAKEALEKLNEGGYEAVFTDIKMPGMSGIELTEQMKLNKPWLPVVIITGYGTTDDEARAKSAGVSAFLNKPLTPDMIESSAMNAVMEVTPEVVNKVEVVEVKNENFFKNVALFLAAPFIGLVYAMLLPLVGFGMIAVLASRALTKKYPKVGVLGNNVAKIAKIIASPFVGLAFILALPFLGLATLAFMGFKALMNKMPSKETMKQIGKFIVSPFVGLAFIILMPIFGLVMLSWVGFQAATVKK